LLPKAKRGPGGHRLYDESDLKRLTFVRRCRDFVLPIEKIPERVSLMDHPAQDCSKARDVAELQLTHVRKKLAELRTWRTVLLTLRPPAPNAAPEGQRAIA
jgi:DNA-binding transcriptional MerR regulator